MSRLIDADALKEYIDKQSGRRFIGCTVRDAMKIMTDEQPTIEERKKGKWIPKPDIYLDEQTWECSECGEPWIFIEGTPSENRAHFCPNCGSDMRGDGDD